MHSIALKNSFSNGVSRTHTHIHTHAHTHTHTHTSHPPTTHTDSCSYKLKLDKGALKVSEVFQLLDSVKTQVGILDWGIKMTTLEDGETTLFYSILGGLPGGGLVGLVYQGVVLV